MKHSTYVVIDQSLFLTACNQGPRIQKVSDSMVNFDKNNIVTTNKNGKQYKVPIYSSYLINTEKNEGIFTHNKNIFKECRVGAILWRSPEFVKTITSTKTAMARYLETAEAIGVAGCAKPIAD